MWSQCSQNSRKIGIFRQVAKKPVQNQDRLDIEQIRKLSDRLIVSLFSDMTSDEIRRKYTLTCYLMPRTCTHEVSVFGNEMRAKKEMRQHLREHVQQLLLVKSEGSPKKLLSAPNHFDAFLLVNC